MKLLIIPAALASFVAPAAAHYYNASYDCGRGQTVWVGNPVVGHGDDRKRIIIFEIKISDFDFNKGPVRSPVVQWDPDKDAVTLGSRPCRQTDDDVLPLGR